MEIREFHWLMNIVQNLDVGLVVLDKGYRVQVWNGFMESHSGRLAGEVRERQKVGNGQVVIFENDEAYRFAGDAPVRKLIIKVTVEGGYFKNK